MKKAYFFAFGLITAAYGEHAAQAAAAHCPATFTFEQLKELYTSVDDNDKVIDPKKLIGEKWGHKFRPHEERRAIDLAYLSIRSVDTLNTGSFQSKNALPNAAGKCCYEYKRSGANHSHKALAELCLEDMTK